MARPLDQITYPKDADEWWMLVVEHEENLTALVARYHPWYSRTHNHKITAGRAEALCEEYRQQIHREQITDPEEPALKMKRMIEAKDRKLSTLFSETWFGMPESSSVRSEDGFGILCDLCSEAGVLYDDTETDEA